ncbi:hypothetical protein LINPERHAP2_LOCUS15467, partial [Linum perenne]
MNSFFTMPRTYKAWSQQEEIFFYDILLALYEAGNIQGGTLRDCGYTDIQKQLKVLAPNTKQTADSCKTKFRYGHKLAAGMNNTKLHMWDELCKIFEVNRADGTESMTPADAVSRLEGQLRASWTTFDNYAAETTPMMEDFINEGYDMNAEGLKDVEEDTATKDPTDN